MFFFFFLITISTWAVFKLFIESVTLLLPFWFFGQETCGISAPFPTPLHWKAKSQSPDLQGSPRKSFKTKRLWEEDSVSDIPTLNLRVELGIGQL